MFHLVFFFHLQSSSRSTVNSTQMASYFPVCRFPPHGADRLHPAISPKRQEEPFHDHLRQLVLGDGDEPECLVEADQLQGRMHVQLFMPAGIDQCLHHEPGKATPAVFFKREDAVDFVPVGMQSAPRYRGKRAVDKGAEDAVFRGVGLLLVVVVPDLFLKGDFGGGEFAGVSKSR